MIGNFLFSRKIRISVITIALIGAIVIPSISGNIQKSNNEYLEENQQRSFGDTTSPVIIINFAGNPKDLGGPYWRPPFETIPLTSLWENGYYTTGSRQIEDWMYINITVTDSTGMDEVWLHWLEGTTWHNTTNGASGYPFRHAGGDYWEFNSRGNITTVEGCNYSFDVWAADTVGNTALISWYKIGLLGTFNRRYVQLNCAPTDITYSPYYCYTATYTNQDKMTLDRLNHDQGPDGSLDDTGFLLDDIPTDKMHERHCGLFIGYWFDESVCVEPFTLKNIYQHFWWGTLEDPDNPKTQEVDLNATVAWSKSREQLPLNTSDESLTFAGDAPTSIIFKGDEYYLKTNLITLSTPINISDNNVYELIPLHIKGDAPTCINNRSIVSFILFNVPDNDTLNTSYPDSDSDGLSDWTELYITYTNPFLIDTDNDYVSDYGESLSGSDPNDYTDTLLPPFICGDCNNDELLNNADVVYLVNYLFRNGPEPLPVSCVGDVNSDRKIAIEDLVYLINYLYRNGPVPDGCCE